MKEQFMREALHMADEGMCNGHGGPFGAVVVKEGKVIGRGCNRVTSTNDPTAHAEIVAIRDACQNVKNFSLEGAEIYTSCEPCPMCLAAIYWARITRIYYGNTRQDAADIGFDDDFIYREVPLPLEKRSLKIEPLLREEAQLSFKAWLNKEDKIPY